MILKIRNSRFSKAVSLLMALVFILTLNPTGSFALTGGPAQPEFNAFTPIGTSDMVDLASGDFSYNIPLMDIGGFPINLAYSSGVTMDQEASWVGLGWDLSIGQINRQMRGLPDDFDGDQMQYENNTKDNYTVGTTFSIDPGLFGVEFKGLSTNLTAQYNSYDGFTMNPSAGISYDISNHLSVGLNVSSGPDGLTLSPNASLSSKLKTKAKRDMSVSGNVGLSFNARQGISKVNMSTSTSSVFLNKKHEIKENKSVGTSASISFVDNTYTPTTQDRLTSANFTFNASIGGEFFGVEGEQNITAFGSTQYIREEDKDVTEKVYGYNYTHLATENDILDFNREKDGNFSVNSTNLPLTNYTYDIYSVQGQGVGGMFRPYRSQIGYVYDNQTNSFGGGGSLGIEVGAGNLTKVGVDVEVTTTAGESGGWYDGNNALETFTSDPSNNPKYEEVYYKNVGDLAVDQDVDMYGNQTKLFGGYFPSRLKLEGDAYNRTLANINQIKKANQPNEFVDTDNILENDIKRSARVQKSQSVLNVSYGTALDAETALTPLIGFNLNTTLDIDPSQTAGFIVTRNDGARYVYGEAIYNTTKREVTFAIGKEVGGGGESGNIGNPQTGLVKYEPGVDNSINNGKGDHYFNRITTPAYAHTYLLTTLLSTDYSDVDGIPGPSAGDYGSFTNFEYNNVGNYKWRIPFEQNEGNFNEGTRTDPTDDKGSYVYGEKEQSYIKKIETKTHVAIFHISPRRDGYGVASENGGIGTDSKMYKLDKVVLYSRGEFYDKHGNPVSGTTDAYGNFTSSATPIKTVHFVYDYSLCVGVPNNDLGTELDENEISNEGGKLTLKKVYFTYRNSKMGKYSAYNFTYGDTDHEGGISEEEQKTRNPEYNLKGYDIWGNYKPNSAEYEIGHVPGGILDQPYAPEYNYVDQEDENTDNYVAAWSITDIELPSGGIIKIDYEADDYQYVQDKKAMQMFKVAGAGHYSNPYESATENKYFEPNDLDVEDPLINQADDEALLYDIGSDNLEARYLYIKLPEEDQDMAVGVNAEFYRKYLKTIVDEQDKLIQFRFFTNMSHKGGKNANWEKGDFEYVSGYFEFDIEDGYNVFTGVDGLKYASIRMKSIDKETGTTGSDPVNPISKAGWQFGRKYLSKYVYGFPEPDAGSPASAIVNTIIGTSSGLLDILKGPNGTLRVGKIARRFIPEKSWIRLSSPSGTKKGGGSRVRQLVMTDEWDSMIGGDASTGQKYGQEYEYTLLNGSSSGVATYEPVGSKENPLVQPVFVNVNRLLAPDEENYTEKPFGESFFPSPSVTYSRVLVKNIERYKGEQKLTKHATGSVVTEFFTSKDYPTLVDQTKIQVEEDKPGLLADFLNINNKKHLTLSQGYLIHLNDMNGKMKSQRVYAEGQSDFISGVDYNYDHFSSAEVGAEDPFALVSHNPGKLNNKVKVLYPNGQIKEQTIGVEYDVINDFREQKSETEIVGINTNVATFLAGVFPVIVPVPIPDYAHHEDKLNMATTTKIINTFGIQREVVAHDAGASVFTRNLLWDAVTGEVLLTETINEYGDRYYSLNYPAHWYYKGMGLASLNSGIEMFCAASGGGFAISPDYPGTEKDYLFDGDEVLLAQFNLLEGVNYSQKAWVHNVSATGFKLMDENGEPIEFTKDFGKIKIIRSGRRNLQSTSMGSIVMMENPLNFFTGGYIPISFLKTMDWSKYKIVNAGSVEFSELWNRQCECGNDSTGLSFNPYVQNTKGIWRADKSWLYLTGRHQNDGHPDPRNDGFYNTFSPFYYVDGGGNWHKYTKDWTFTSEVTEYSSYGFELENQDALKRKSAAQYGYNFSFPLAVGANAGYSEIGYDGFEDYKFDGCSENEHFGFRDPVNANEGSLDSLNSHTGKRSLKLNAGNDLIKVYHLDCEEETPPAP